jgi:hypothetical protein
VRFHEHSSYLLDSFTEEMYNKILIKSIDADDDPAVSLADPQAHLALSPQIENGSVITMSV